VDHQSPLFVRSWKVLAIVEAHAIVATMERTLEVASQARTVAAAIRIAQIGLVNRKVFDWVTDSVLPAMAVTFGVQVHAVALAVQVRIADAILAVLGAEVDTIRDAPHVVNGARTMAVAMWIADVGLVNHNDVFDWLADSTFLAMAVTLGVPVHAVALAAKVRIADAILAVPGAEVDTIRDAPHVANGARTTALTVRVADIDNVIEARTD